MATPDKLDDSESIRLAPIDPATDEARRRMRQLEAQEARSLVAEMADEVADSPPAPRWQFTLGRLLLGNTVAAVILAVLQWMAPSLVAGALGVVAYLFLLIVTIHQPQRREFYAIAWALVAMYVLVSIVALLRQ
jgi:hypothetical protein